MPSLVLELRDTHEVGGPGKTILETHRAIDAKRFRLNLGVFLSPGDTPDTPFVRAARECGMPVHFIAGRSRYDPGLVWRLSRLIRGVHADIVHSHDVRTDVLAYLASLLHPVPIVATLHGWIGNSARRRAMNSLDRRLVRRFDAAIAVSQAMRATLIKAGGDPNRIQLLHNAVVLERYRRTGSRGKLAELLGSVPPPPVLACVGRLSPEKGQADLLEALRILVGRGRRLSVVFAGEGPDRSRLVDVAHRSGLEGLVFFPGYLVRPQDVLEEIDLLVLPSHTEGLPNSALEALAMEVPVLATRVGGTPELVRDGLSGRLVPAHSPGQLADMILDFLEDPVPWRDMARRGREIVEAEFSFATRTRRLEGIYQEILNGASRRPR